MGTWGYPLAPDIEKMSILVSFWSFWNHFGATLDAKCLPLKIRKSKKKVILGCVLAHFLEKC